MTGIILKYRCPRRPGEVKSEPPLGPQLDAQRAVSLVRGRAAEWGIDPNADRHRRLLGGRPSRARDRHRFRASGCTNRSTPSTKSVAGPTSPSPAIRAI